MEGFTDLLADAFAEASLPSLTDEELDFETFCFEKTVKEYEGKKTTNSDETSFQEATAETAAVTDKEAEGLLYETETDHKKQSSDESDEELSGKAPENDPTSSNEEFEQEGSVSGEDKEESVRSGEDARDFLIAVHCSDEFYHRVKEDSFSTEGQPLTVEAKGKPQDNNEVQCEAKSDEKLVYFGGVPGCGNDVMIKGSGTEEDKQEREDNSSDSIVEDMRFTQEKNENVYRSDPSNHDLDFPNITFQNLQDLIAEVDNEKYQEKMTDFSGEEHQEAGECFAEYPSELSSFEYAEEGRNYQENKSDDSTRMKQNPYLENNVTEKTWRDHIDDKNKEEFLYSKDNEMMGLDGTASVQDEEKSRHLLDEGNGTAGNSSSSDDEEPFRRTSEKLLDSLYIQEYESVNQLEETCLYGESSAAVSGWGSSDEFPITNSRTDSSNYINWDFDVLKADSFLSEHRLNPEDMNMETTYSLYEKQFLTADGNSYSEVQEQSKEMTKVSNQGSLDDSFFFNSEMVESLGAEPGQLDDDNDSDEDRNWEHEQERIKAFYRFYDDSEEENKREDRQRKVQFCADPLSQVICYETDCSDTESFSSSTDQEDDLNCTEMVEELRESEDDLQTKPPTDSPKTQQPEIISAPKSTQICTGIQKGLGALKLIMKMTVVMVMLMGMLKFWLTTDQMDWFMQHFF